MRATKKNKGTGKKAATNGLSGVSHDEHGPVIEETLTDEQRNIRSAAANGLRDRLDQMEADWIAKRTEYRNARKALALEERELRESARLGIVKVPAQKSLPGTEADA